MNPAGAAVNGVVCDAVIGLVRICTVGWGLCRGAGSAAMRNSEHYPQQRAERLSAASGSGSWAALAMTLNREEYPHDAAEPLSAVSGLSSAAIRVHASAATTLPSAPPSGAELLAAIDDAVTRVFVADSLSARQDWASRRHPVPNGNGLVDQITTGTARTV